MRKIEVKFVYMTLGELRSLVKYEKSNRNHYYNVNDALNNGHIGKEAESGNKRIKKTIKEIFNNGKTKWSVFCPLVLGKNFVVIEGQGRINSQFVMLDDKNNTNVTENDVIPCLIYPNCTADEVKRAIKEMNTNKTNWSVRDYLHYEAENGNEFVKDILDETADWMEKLKVKSVNSVLIFIMKSYASNHLDEAVKDIKNGKINSNRNMMLTSYYNCVKNCPDKLDKKLVTSNGAYLMNGLIRHIVRYCESNKLDCNKYLAKFEKIFEKSLGKYSSIDFNDWFKGSLGNKTFYNVLYNSTKDNELKNMIYYFLNPSYYSNLKKVA